MTDEAMSPLRRRMIEDMTIRKLGRKTQQDYIQIIKKLAAFLGRSPDTATFEDLRRFQLHVVASGVGAAAINRHRRLSGAAAQDRMGRLFKAPVRRTRGGAGLSLPLYPPRCHRHSPPHRIPRRAHYLRVE